MERKPHLRIVVTAECNFNCKYCKEGGEGVYSKVEMSLDELIRVARISYEVGFRHVKITGGEPLLRQKIKGDIFELILQLKKIGYTNVQMVTNGYYLSEYCETLVGSGLDSLTVSLDTVKKEKYNDIVGNDSFERVIEGIKLLAKKIPIRINTVVYNKNQEDIIELIGFAQEIGIGIKLLDYVQFDDGYSKKECEYVDFDFLYEKLTEEGYEYCYVGAPGGLGTPMRKYSLDNGAFLLVKDARVATNYNLSVCKECEFFPCQDAMISLRITANGKLKRCLIRDDNLVDVYEDLKSMNYASVKEKIARMYDLLCNSEYFENKWRINE